MNGFSNFQIIGVVLLFACIIAFLEIYFPTKS